MNFFYTYCRRIASLLFVIAVYLQANAQTPPYYKGTGTATNTIPMNTTGSHCQQIYLPTDFNTVPISGLITKIYFRNSVANGTGTYTNFSVAFLQNNLTAFANTTFLTGFTNALSASSITINGNATAGGWYAIPLTTPFLYDNSQSLIVEVKYDSKTGGMSGYTTTAAVNKRLSIITAPGAATGNLSTLWGDFGIEVIPNSPCTSPATPGTITGAPATAICPASPVSLNLTGNSVGTGQTYLWQKSTDAAPPHTWTDVAPASSATPVTVNPTATTFYRAGVTCSGVTVYTDSVKVIVNPLFPGGTYTINSGVSTGGGNYQTFADAVSAISCGIAGPVIFNVAPGSGPYNEQVIIPAIGGTSAINTVKFNGNGETLTYTSTNTAQRATIKLNAADYITIDNFNIIAGGSATTEYGYGIQLVDDADNNTISNCTITCTSTPATAASTAFAGIVVNASTGTTSVAVGNSLCDNNIITNNRVTGGYVGIAIMANGSTSTVSGNSITGNTVKDFYTFGIKVGGNNGTLIELNDVSRPVRASVTTCYAIDLDGYSIKTKVSRNSIHDPYGGSLSNTAAAYGIRLNACDATAGNENIVSNNFIYSFIGATGVQNGILNNSSDYSSFYYNSILLDDAGASCACAARGIYFQSTTIAGLDIRNNTISISRGGTGEKQGLYFEPTSVASYTIDYNNYYLTAAAGTQEFGHIGTSGYTTLAAWQSGSSKDAASQQSDPMFISPSDLHLQPSSPIQGLGTPIASVTNDIDGNTRSASAPNIGADEFAPITGIDMRPGALISPAVSAKGCYATETITVSVNNNSINPIDFSVNNLSVTVQVAGPAGNANYSATVNTGTLAGGASQNVTVTVPSSTINMNTVGEYNFSISTSVTGDVNASNNSVTIKRTRNQLSAGTLSAPQTSFCVSGTPQLIATGADGYSSFKWQQSTTSGSGYTDIAGANTTTYTLPSAITQSRYYQAVATCGIQNETGTPEIFIQVNNPQVTGTTPGSRCGVGTVNLSAAGNAADLAWYAASSGGAALGTGNNFTTPSISATTTYYVAANTGGSSMAMASPTIGTSTFITTTTGWGLRFTVNSAATIESVKVRANATTAGSASIQIKVTDLSDVVLYTGTMYNFSITTTLADYVVPVNISLPPGNYKMGMTYTGITNMVRESSGLTFPYNSTGNEISITAGANGAGTAQTTAAYYWFYNWQISTGCEGTRVPVVATVNTPPALTITPGATICNNTIKKLEVTSTISDYNSYVWSPLTDLFTDAAATLPYAGGNATQVYVKSSTASAQVYTLTATNTTSQCSNVATSTITTLPDPSITATPSEICVSGTSALVLNPSTGYGAGTLQWQLSTNGTLYNDIASATNATYTTPTITQTSYYKVIIKDGAGVTCSQSPTVTVTVNNPQVTGTTPASRCGTGTVNLSATGSAGTTLNWYAAASGGVALASGTTFTTPSISSTTTYYVGAISGGGTANVGKASLHSSAGTGGGLASYMNFDALSDFTLKTVDIYPYAATAGINGTITIELRNSSGTSLMSKTVNIVTANNTSAPAQTVTLDFPVTTGTNYRLGVSAWTGATNMYRDDNANAGVNISYPYTLPGVVSITGASLTGYYYFFYNWLVSTGCESARTAVVATVTNPASNAAGAVGTTECAANTIAGTTEYNFTDCDPIAIITPNGALPISGSVNSCVKIDATVQTASTGEPYVQRHYDITPAVNPLTATSVITFYFLQSEFDAFNTASGFYAKLPIGPSDAAGKANLRITQYNGTGTAPGNYTGTATLIDPADASIIWNSTSNRWEVTINVTGSGGFYVHTGKFVLPVTGIELKGSQQGVSNKLSWNTLTETNNKGFELQRSADGKNFSSIASVATKADNGNSTSLLSYDYVDAKPLSGNNYYRLKQVDKDGKFSYSNVVLLGRKVTEITLSGVYPNPTERELNLVITSPKAEKITIIITDVSGKVIMQRSAQLMTGDNQQRFNVMPLAAGTYIVKAICADGCETAVHRFVKQ